MGTSCIKADKFYARDDQVVRCGYCFFCLRNSIALTNHRLRCSAHNPAAPKIGIVCPRCLYITHSVTEFRTHFLEELRLVKKRDIDFNIKVPITNENIISFSNLVALLNALLLVYVLRPICSDIISLKEDIEGFLNMHK